VTVISHPATFNALPVAVISHLAMFNGLPATEIGHLVMFRALPVTVNRYPEVDMVLPDNLSKSASAEVKGNFAR
jgi:hypothetical protein